MSTETDNNNNNDSVDQKPLKGKNQRKEAKPLKILSIEGYETYLKIEELISNSPEGKLIFKQLLLVRNKEAVYKGSLLNAKLMGKLQSEVKPRKGESKQKSKPKKQISKEVLKVRSSKEWIEIQESKAKLKLNLKSEKDENKTLELISQIKDLTNKALFLEKEASNV
jgi:hypothetical protein